MVLCIEHTSSDQRYDNSTALLTPFTTTGTCEASDAREHTNVKAMRNEIQRKLGALITAEVLQTPF